MVRRAPPPTPSSTIAYHCSITPDLQWLPVLRELLVSLLREASIAMPHTLLWRCQVAQTEAVTNAMVHGTFSARTTTAIDVEWQLTPQHIHLRVEHPGPVFTLPRRRVVPTPAEHGRGLQLIRSYADRVVLTHRAGRNRLVMSFCRSVGAAGDTPPDFDQAALQSVHRLSEAIVRAPGLTDIFDCILREAVRMIPVRSASILQYDVAERALRVVAAVGLSKKLQREIRVPVGSGISGKVFAQSQPILIADARRDPQAARRRRYQSHSLISAPVTRVPHEAHTHPLGVINMTDKRDGSDFTARDLLLLQTMANQAAAYMHLCTLADQVTAAQAMEKEFALAREIQLGLLPPQPVCWRDLEAAGLCVPCATVGGDYFDFFPDVAGAPGVVIADVAGHHMSAALTMAAVRSMLRTEMTHAGESLAVIVGRLNTQLYADLARAEQFVTCLLARYDRASGVLRLCGAGHPAPLLLRRGGRVQALPSGDGPVLGLAHVATYEESLHPVQVGDVVLFYTDGLTGIVNARGHAFGERRLARALSALSEISAKAMVNQLRDQVFQFAGPTAVTDDVTLMAMKIRK